MTFLAYELLIISYLFISLQETNIEKVKIGLQANLPTPELAQLMISLLDQLVLDCK